ncbi:Pumilio-like proteiny domain family member 6 [Colletotrichum siamense]|uniref:Pumilio-like proteiny domain family member 6 n=1 Tax=Colletotrichum siamense TaxID=690259 RepID=A0A9P5BRW1_COLSI|nr:Pumilio-like proteiny domain family member 6 [Colletotrichum siamense]KAF4847589.1 Pumilio-like proteiny domain family member 6 [Colletotrichum siamense]
MAANGVKAGSKRKTAPASKGASDSKSKKTKFEKKAAPVETPEDDEMEDAAGSSDSDDGGVKLNPRERAKQAQANGKKEGANFDKSKQFEKGQTSKESHAIQKKLALERKAAKPLADEVQRTKKIWERLRRKSHVPSEERKQLVDELFSIITGRIKEFVLKHDATRAVQTAIKYATAAQRKQITKELQGTYAQLAESRYAKFLIAKLIVQADAEIKEIIVPEFYGKVRKLINHPEASWILDDIYRQIATKEQKAIILREWYGPEFALLERNKDEKPTSDLSEILEEKSSKRGPILKSLHDMINSLVQKKMTGFTMLHDAMLQYFLNIKPGTDDFTMFLEMIKDDETGDLLKNMAFTRSGSRLVALLLAHGSSKDRRNLLRAFRDNFVLMSGDPFAHIVILTAFDVIDDTKMTQKAIFPELIGDDKDRATENIVVSTTNPFARATLLYLLEGQSRAIFPASMNEDLAILNEVHEIRQTTSKKDADMRRKELVAAISPALIEAVVSSAHTLVADPFGCQLVADVVLSAEGDKTKALEAVAAVAEGDPSAEPMEEDGIVTPVHVSRTPFGGRLIKTLIAGGKFNKETGKVEAVDPPLKFSDILYPVIKDYILDWATGPSSFVVLNMLEAEDFSHASELKKMLKAHKKDLQKAATEESAEQKADREARAQKEAEKSEKGAKKGKKGGDKPVGNLGSKLLLEKL